MKKILCTLLVAMLTMTGMVSAETPDLTGDWYADVFGMTASMTLNADGTCSMTVMGETQTDVWTFDGTNVIMGTAASETEVMLGVASGQSVIIYDAEKQTLSDETGMLVFTREVKEAWAPAAAIADAALEAFAGKYEGFKMEVMGMYMDVASMGLDMKVAIDGTHVTLTAGGMGMAETEQIEAVYADGALTMTSAVDNTAYTVNVLEDGSLAMTFDMMGTPAIVYCIPAAE